MNFVQLNQFIINNHFYLSSNKPHIQIKIMFIIRVIMLLFVFFYIDGVFGRYLPTRSSSDDNHYNHLKEIINDVSSKKQIDIKMEINQE